MAGKIISTFEPRIDKSVTGPAKTFKQLINVISFVPGTTDDEATFKGGINKDTSRHADRTDDGDNDKDDVGKIKGYGVPNSDNPLYSDADSPYDMYKKMREFALQNEAMTDVANASGAEQLIAQAQVPTVANQQVDPTLQMNNFNAIKECMENIATKSAEIFDLLKADKFISNDVVNQVKGISDMIDEIYNREAYVTGGIPGSAPVPAQTPKYESNTIKTSFADFLKG